VIACGDPSFTKFIRDDVRRISSSKNVIQFKEVEYRPYGLHNKERTEYLIGWDEKKKRKNLNPKQNPNKVSRWGSEESYEMANMENCVKVDPHAFV
jgi:hypothetical protein